MKAYILNENLSVEFFSTLETVLNRKYSLLHSYDISIESLDANCDIVIVVYPVVSEEVGLIKEKVFICYQKGLKVVAFYADNDLSYIPEEISTAGFSSITMQSDEIESFLEGKVVWEKPDGSKSGYNDIVRNKCIKPKKDK